MQFKTDQKRIFGLDIVRAIAIVLVVLTHGGFLLKGSLLEGFPYFKMIDGVDMFFVLSGFLIGGILLKEINKSTQFNSPQLFNFWKRRWFRTLPNYYLILLLNYLVVRYGIINEDIDQFNFSFLFFTHNFSSPFYGFFWESWSLSVEEWFYIFTPILVFVLLRVIPARQSFLIATLAVILLPIIYRISIYDSDIDYFGWDITFRKVVLCRLDSIGYGLLAAWTYFYYNRYWEKIKTPALVAGIGLMIFVINFKAGPGSVYRQNIYFSLIPISVMFIIPFAESIKSAKGRIAYAIQHISKISYSMYLINLALVAEVIRDNFAPQNGTDGIMKYLLYWIIVILASSLLYKYFEKPMMNLRDKDFKLLFQKRK